MKNISFRSTTYPEMEEAGNVAVGIDGNAVFALLGRDLQEGEAIFLTLPENADSKQVNDLARKAFVQLKAKLNKPELEWPHCGLCGWEWMLLDYQDCHCE